MKFKRQRYSDTFWKTNLSKNSVKMVLLMNGGNSHINQICAILPNIKPTETFNLLQTARDISELKHVKC